MQEEPLPNKVKASPVFLIYNCFFGKEWRKCLDMGRYKHLPARGVRGYLSQQRLGTLR
jgi:hypothetical protein